MKRLLLHIALCLACLTASAQALQTYLPNFKKGQKVHYEYTYTTTSTNTNDGSVNNDVNAYPLFQADNMNSIYQRAVPGEVYTSKFSLNVLEATPYNYTFELDIEESSNILSMASQEPDVLMLKIIDQSLKKVKPVITFPRDMSSFLINNKREIIAQFGEDLWTYMIKDQQYSQQLEDEMPDKDEMINQLTTELNKGNELYDDLNVLCPGFNALTQAYCQPFAIGSFEAGQPLNGYNRDDVYEKQSATIGSDGALNFNNTVEFFRYMNDNTEPNEYSSIDKKKKNKTPEDNIHSYETYPPTAATADDVRCSVQIEMKSNADTWMELYRVASIADFRSSIWVGREHLKRIG